jgi:pimeloyl-ACP methyl ester carboxylesterase
MTQRVAEMLFFGFIFFYHRETMKWLMMRGLVREQRHWGSFKEIFKNKVKSIDPNAEVLTLDLPGFGTEINRVSPKTIDGIVEDIRGRWKKLNTNSEENWGLLAVSLGGMVAAHWCNKYPEDFVKVVLINSSMSGLSPIHHRMTPKNYPRIIKLLFSFDLVHRERNILKMTTNLDHNTVEVQANVQAPYGAKVNRLNAVYQIFAATTFKAPKEIKVPMMVLVGDGDQLVSPKCSEAIAKQYGATLKRHPTANHDLATDAPDWIAEEVCNWTF